MRDINWLRVRPENNFTKQLITRQKLLRASLLLMLRYVNPIGLIGAIMESETLHFDVSTGLKSVLGSELITDDAVAIFELVKNSFDANARHVDLFFSDDKIVVSDNGAGMTLDDVKTKWLFVAYSAKRNADKSKDFRDEIAERKHYAGSKGVGRLSSDRLGRRS